MDNYSRSNLAGSVAGSGGVGGLNTLRDDSSGSEDGIAGGGDGVQFYLGGIPTTPIMPPTTPSRPHLNALDCSSHQNHIGVAGTTPVVTPQTPALPQPQTAPALPLHINALTQFPLNDSNLMGENNSRHSPSLSSIGSERSLTVPPRTKKQKQQQQQQQPTVDSQQVAPLPPPRKTNQSEMLRSQSADLLPMEIYGYIGRQQFDQQKQQQQQQHHQHYKQTANQSFLFGSQSGSGSSTPGIIFGGTKKMVKQLSNASQQSSSSGTSSSVQSAPSHIGSNQLYEKGQSIGCWSSNEHYLSTMQQRLPPMPHSDTDTPKTSICESSNSAASTSATSVASAYSNTTIEDDISLTGSIKKRKRRLRFPFSRRKSNESNNSVKNKFA